MSRLHQSAFLLLLVLVLVAVGCGGTLESATPASANASPDVTSSPVAATAEEDAANDAAEDEPSAGFESPVAELFGIPVSDPDALTDQTTQLQVEAERRIAECMRAQGFEYTPVDYSQFAELDAAIAFDGKEFAEEYGFGVATSIGGDFAGIAEGFSDPNGDYLSSLSAGEQEAYFNALVGGSLTIDSFDEAQDFEPAGCQGEAYEAAFGSFASFDEFGDELDAMEEQIASDPRVVEANASWAACMFDRGYGYTDAEDARSDIERRYDELVRSDTGGGFPEGAVEGADDDGGDGGGVIIMGGPIFSPETQAEVDELGAEEREVAVASWECEQPIAAVLDEVRIGYELRFVEQYGDAVRAVTGG